MLTIYVDDFKLSGPQKNLRRGWELISSVLEIEAEGPEGRKASRYLGCEHIIGEAVLPSGKKVRTMTYDMEDYLASIVTDYEKLADASGVKINLAKNIPTPFLEEDQRKAPARAPNKEGLPNEVPADKKTPFNAGVPGVTSDAGIIDFNVLGWNAQFIEAMCEYFDFAKRTFKKPIRGSGEVSREDTARDALKKLLGD